MHGDSILFADYASKTWCYLTTPDESALAFMRNVFKAIVEKEHGDDAIRTATYLTTPPPKKQGEGSAVNPFSEHAAAIKDMHDSRTIHAYSNQVVFMDKLASALKGDAFRREFISTRKYSMNYGTFDHLRNQLVQIK